MFKVIIILSLILIILTFPACFIVKIRPYALIIMLSSIIMLGLIFIWHYRHTHYCHLIIESLITLFFGVFVTSDYLLHNHKE